MPPPPPTPFAIPSSALIVRKTPYRHTKYKVTGGAEDSIRIHPTKRGLGVGGGGTETQLCRPKFIYTPHGDGYGGGGGGRAGGTRVRLAGSSAATTRGGHWGPEQTFGTSRETLHRSQSPGSRKRDLTILSPPKQLPS